VQARKLDAFIHTLRENGHIQLTDYLGITGCFSPLQETLRVAEILRTCLHES
jgi:hypothetical protein